MDAVATARVPVRRRTGVVASRSTASALREVFTLTRTDPGEFVQKVQPLLERQDPAGLLHLLKSNWTVDDLTAFLAGEHEDARKVAALALSLVGGKCCLPPLARQLRNDDPIVNQMAEHAMWGIWFR